VGFAANYIDGLAKMNVELDHLSVQSGISVTSLAGLQQLVREMGGEWDPIATGLVKMNQNLAASKEPSKELERRAAWRRISVPKSCRTSALKSSCRRSPRPCLKPPIVAIVLPLRRHCSAVAALR
jgi:hypothetical protein